MKHTGDEIMEKVIGRLNPYWEKAIREFLLFCKHPFGDIKSVRIDTVTSEIIVDEPTISGIDTGDKILIWEKGQEAIVSTKGIEVFYVKQPDYSRVWKLHKSKGDTVIESVRVTPLISLTEDEVQKYTHLKDEEIKKFMVQLNSDIWAWIGEELATFQEKKEV